MRWPRRIRLKIAGKNETVGGLVEGVIDPDAYTYMLPTDPPKYRTESATLSTSWKVTRPKKGWGQKWRKG